MNPAYACVPVMPNARLRAYPKHAQGGRVSYMPIARALSSTYTTDAHFSGYSVPEIARRLDKKVVSTIEAGVSMVLLAFDVDGPEHQATEAWWQGEREKLNRLFAKRPGFAYRTKGGYRIVFLLERPIYIKDDGDARAWRALYVSWCKSLAREFGIDADRGCKEWGRLFRLPHATRDGNAPEMRETVGNANAIGVWNSERHPLLADDFAIDEEKNTAKAKESPRTSSYSGPGRLVTAFDRRGWLGNEIETGKYAVRCPFEHAHTCGETYDGSTVIYEADAAHGDLGWFHCSHGHCADRSIGAVIGLFSDEEMSNPPKCGATTKAGTPCAWTDLYSDGKCMFHSSADDAKDELRERREKEAAMKREECSTAGQLAEIEITTNEAAVGDRTIEVLSREPNLYQRAGKLCSIATIKKLARTKQGTGEHVVPAIVEEESPTIRSRMTRLAQFVAWKKDKSGEMVRAAAHPPRWLIEDVLSRRTWPSIRVIEMITEAPVLRFDGTVLDSPGYDERTGLYFVPSDDFGTVSEKPTHTEAVGALAELSEVFADFPFAEEMHKSAALAALLTMFARHAIGENPTPLFLIDKNVRGAGSGLLVDAISLIATGRNAPLFVHPEDDTEMQKQITALVLEGATTAVIDNVNNGLGSAALDAALTGRSWNQRILGKSQSTNNLPIRMTWFATGNNVAIQADTARRVCHIRLESQEERPEERTGFKHPNLREWVLAERGRLVRAALTVLRAYAIAGRPAVAMKEWGSFEEWSGWVRGALVWAEAADPGETRSELSAQSDTEGNALAMLIEALENADPRGTGLTANQMLKLCGNVGNDYESLREAIEELCPTANGKPVGAKGLGKRLSHMRRRVVGGRYLEKIDLGTGRPSGWKIEQTKGAA